MANRQKMNPTRLEVVQIKAPTGFQTVKSIYGKEKAIQINYSARTTETKGHSYRILRFPRGANRSEILHWTCSKKRIS